jgi:hypothetical protein
LIFNCFYKLNEKKLDYGMDGFGFIRSVHLLAS